MASEKEVVQFIFAPMLDLYKAPSGWEQSSERLKALKNQYVQALEPYPVGVLQKAWRNVVARHWGWEWPTLQEIMRECNLCS